MDREIIGGNRPPSTLDFGRQTLADMAVWLDDNPVIDREEIAKDGKLQVDRVRSCLQDMEAERRGETDPLNKEVKDINGRYALVRAPLEAVTVQLKRRLDDYIRAKQQKEREAAEAVQAAIEEARREAAEKQAALEEAMAEADQGVADTKVVEKGLEADKSFRALEVKQRALARADKEIDEARKISGGWRRAYTPQPPKEILVLDDWKMAIEEMGMTDKIAEAIRSSAREFRKIFGHLPEGIRRTEEQDS